MDVTVSLEHRFDSTPDGALWTQTMFAYPFWTRYLEVYDSVRVVARVRNVAEVPSDYKQANGKNVSVAPIPYYIGPWEYVLRSGQVRRAARSAIAGNEAVIMRVGSNIAGCIEPVLQRTGHPYGVEVVGDPYGVYAPGSVRHPFRPFFRYWFPKRLRRQCANACAAAYVTKHALQKRYPPASAAFSTHYSSVELPSESFVATPRTAKMEKCAFTLLLVGTLNQLYKAPDVLIDAVARCLAEGLDIRLVIVGDGRHRHELEERSARLGISSRVIFKGQLPAGEPVRSELDNTDLFVLPSRIEGLPRAIIEAMARAVPCIGSTAGGIPELLPPEDLVPPGDAEALAGKISEVLRNPARMACMSARNLKASLEYRDDLLRARRIAFYRHVKARTAEWLKMKGNGRQ